MPIYNEIVETLFNINQSRGIKPGLENMRRLSELFGNPHRAYRTVHIAGTNGKGSVAVKTAAALQAAGYRTGLYTSPHIATFRERISVNGKLISEQEILELLPPIMEAEVKATFFEITTMLGFLYFKKEKVDFAVIETGMGGRFDATNIITPAVSAITSVGLDHCSFLGETIEEIAREKAGIIKPGIPCIAGPTVPVEGVVKVEGEFEDYNEENNAVARELLRALPVSEDAVLEGLKARPPCRFQKFEAEVPIILDVAHNPDGLKKLFALHRKTYPSAKICTVVGLSADKDIEGCLKIIEENSEAVHLVAGQNKRCSPPERLNALLQGRGVAHPGVSEGIRAARGQAAREGRHLLVCGSFYIMAEAIAEIKKECYGREYEKSL